MQMLEHLLSEYDVLLDQAATVPRQQLEAGVDGIGFVLQQAEPIDRAAMNCQEVGVIGLVAGISGLAELFGGIGVKDADLEPSLEEGTLDRAVIASRPLDDNDQVLDAVPCTAIAHCLDRGLEAGSVVFGCHGLEEDSAVEVGEHHLGAGLGAIDANEGEMFGADRLNARVHHSAWLMNGL